MSDERRAQEPEENRSVQENANRRRRERTRTVEETVDDVAAEMFDEEKFPTTSEEIAADYGSEEIDLPNETETVGSVFDRLVDERYETPEEAREAMFNELTGEAAGMEEYNDERDLGTVSDVEETDPQTER